jgi:hypothetical protein
MAMANLVNFYSWSQYDAVPCQYKPIAYPGPPKAIKTAKGEPESGTERFISWIDCSPLPQSAY